MRRLDPFFPALAGLVAAIAWWGFGTVSKLPSLEAAAPAGLFDFFAYYRPNARYGFGRLAQGEIPLWNPHQGFGLPFLATLQTGVLYPPNWLHLLLPNQLAFAILVATHLGLAAWLAAALARALGATAWGSLVAGLLFAGSSWLVGALWSPPTLYCAAWLPGVLLAVHRIVDRPSAGGIALLAGAVAMQGLTGWPYVLLMSGFAGILFGAGALIEVVVRERRLPVARALLLAAGAGTGVLLAAPQLLPAAELVSQSPRALGALAAEQTVLLTAQHDPTYFLQLLLAQGFNDAVPGVLALPLAALALGWPGPRRVRLALLVGVGAFGLLLSFPLHVPLYGWLRRLPLVADFRFPFRYRLLTTLALSVAAGVGVTRLESSLRRRAGVRWALVAGMAAIVVALQAVPLLRSSPPFPREGLWPGSPERTRLLQALAARTRDGSRIHWQLGGEMAHLYKVGELEGLRVTHDLEPLTPASTARFLNYFETGIVGTLDPRDLERSAMPPGAPKPSGSENYLGGIPFFGHVGIPTEPGRARLLDLASVRYVLANDPPPWLAERYLRLPELGARPAVFENPGALPRAYRVGHAEPEPAEPAQALARLAAPDFDPRRVVLLDRPPPELLSAPVADAAADTTRLLRDEPEHQVIDTRGESAAVVVVTDAFFPGWEAQVDGRPAPLLRANTAFRGVVVPAGEHVVELRYRPPRFRTGILLAAAAAVAAVAAGGARAWRRSGRA